MKQLTLKQNNRYEQIRVGRTVDQFCCMIIKITDKVPRSKAGTHLSGQLVRSGTSPALNYGEAQSGESRKDFIHKMKIVLKELRETSVCLKILQRADLFELGTDIALCTQRK